MSEQKARWKAVAGFLVAPEGKRVARQLWWWQDDEMAVVADRLNALEARLEAAEEAIRSAGPCTPYRWIGTEHCQHGYERGRCPIMAYRSPDALASPDTGIEVLSVRDPDFDLMTEEEQQRAVALDTGSEQEAE